MATQLTLPTPISAKLGAYELPKGWSIISEAGVCPFGERWKERLGQNWKYVTDGKRYKSVEGTSVNAYWIINGIEFVVESGYHVLIAPDGSATA